MYIGFPHEIRPLEVRAALLPDICRQLLEAGNHVLLDHDTGVSAGNPDAGYLDAGGQIAGVTTRCSQRTN
ncbi:MAG: hypothetical protein JSU75_07795 [Gammaproteobacteria bacterium]|nr:MAG: hypothetical protein JSU75_07795 [Gammaproteobacteria bacterium]